MSNREPPPDASEFLARLHERAARIPAPHGTVDELRREIRALLLTFMDRIHDTQEKRAAMKQPWRGAWEEAREDARIVLSGKLDADEVELALAEGDSILKGLPDNPSRGPYEFWVLAVNLQLIRTMAKHHFQHTPLPQFDVVSQFYVNAGVKAFGEHHCLFFQTGAKAFTNLFSKALILLWTEWSTQVQSRPELVADGPMVDFFNAHHATSAFQSIVHAYLFLGAPFGGAYFRLDRNLRELAGKLETGMDRFIVAHEYAHILYKHASERGMLRRDQEIEADRTAIGLTLESMESDTEDYVMPFCGAYIIVGLQELILRTVCAIAKRDFTRQGYPSAFERCVNLLAACERQGILTYPMEQTALGLGQVVSLWYKCVEPSLIATAAGGRKLASIWSVG